MADVKTYATDKDFWNAKAGTFPRYSPGEHNYEARMLAAVREMGVDFSGASLLDIGCGTGMYTIRIAKEARRVFALDISEEMLRIFKNDAAAQSLANIEFILADWKELTPVPPCDLVFCSMSAAIRDDGSREKLYGCPGVTVIYIDFVKRTPSDVMAGLYTRYAVTPKKFDDALVMREWLEKKGMAVASRRVDDKWNVPWQHDELVNACTLTLQRHDITPDREFLASYVEAFRQKDGRYYETTEFSADILVWRNPGTE